MLSFSHSFFSLSCTLQGAGGVGGLLAVIRDGEAYAPTYDANGNVSEYVQLSAVQTDNYPSLPIAGGIVAHYEYSPFGEITAQSVGMADDFVFRFSTKPYCSILSKVEFELRIYDPGIGCWLSRDPIDEDSGLKLYGFVENDGINQADLLGLAGVDKTALAYGEVGGCVLKQVPEKGKDGKIITKYVVNEGLADVIESLAAVANRNSSTFTKSKPDAKKDPLGYKAWTAIKNATGGQDKSNGALYYCINAEPPCGNKSACATCQCENGLWKRGSTQRPVDLRATLTLGSCKIYFYNFSFKDESKGWCTKEDQQNYDKHTEECKTETEKLANENKELNSN